MDQTCDTCKASFPEGVGGVSRLVDGDVIGYTCENCWREERIKKYSETGEFNSSLGMDATMAAMRLSDAHAPRSLGRLRDDVREYYLRHHSVLLEIAAIVEEYHKAEREFEHRHWLPRIQQYYREAESRGHSAEGDGFRALLWGSAGRVLLTIQDKHSQGDAESRFGGANVTMIFDETSPTARGGIQSYVGTKEEVLGLLKAATETELQFHADSEVCVA